MPSPATATKEQMLACPAAMPMLRNQWYIAALSTEITSKPLLRQICGEDIVFFRTADGEAVALTDRCPHRGVPLSMGTAEGGILRCAYHGFEFDRAGHCTLVPSQSTVASQIRVRSYPVIEVEPYLWIWTGEGDGDRSLLPDQHAIGLTREGWRVTAFFKMEFDCNYELLHENLLDTSHISFLHTGLIDSGPIARAKANMEFKGNSVRVWRDVIEEPTPAMAGVFHLEPGKPINRTLITESIAPCLSVITNIFTFPDQPDRPPHIQVSPQGVTPMNDRKCLNFCVISTSYPNEQPPETGPALWHLFSQDQLILGRAQDLFDKSGWELPEVSVRADAAALNFRRKMAAMVEQERAGAAGAWKDKAFAVASSSSAARCAASTTES